MPTFQHANWLSEEEKKDNVKLVKLWGIVKFGNVKVLKFERTFTLLAET